MYYVAANNSEVPNRGEIDVEGVTEQGHKVNVTFQDAEVGVPILSVGELTDSKHKVDFEDHGGEILHKPTGTVTPFVRKLGVYFVKIMVPRSSLEKSNFPDEDKSSRFGRPGMSYDASVPGAVTH